MLDGDVPTGRVFAECAAAQVEVAVERHDMEVERRIGGDVLQARHDVRGTTRWARAVGLEPCHLARRLTRLVDVDAFGVVARPSVDLEEVVL